MALPSVGGPLVWAFVTFASVLHLLEQYLEVRQLRKNRETQIPHELEGTVDTEHFQQSQAYQSDKRQFGVIRSWINFAWDKVGLFMLTPLAWQMAVSVCGAQAEYYSTLLWLLLMHWFDKPLNIPLSLYSIFVVEERHGFNKMTLKLYFMDMLKSELLTYVFGGLFVPLIIWIVRTYGAHCHLYLWGTCQFLMMAMMWIYPNVIQPLFNKFQPVEDQELRADIEALAAEVKFPLTKLFQIDGSTRSSHSNAYFFGFWKYKRIVLYDTLLHLKREDILAIICHELGHWKFSHTLTNLCIASAHLFVLFWMFGKVMYSGEVSKSMIRQFGFGDTEAVMVSLMLFMLLVSPVEQFLNLAMTILSRKFEFQADAFAAQMGRAAPLRSGLHQIHQENKGELNPDEWYSWYHFSHPPLVERLRALKALESAGEKKAD
mmetsp:Transcript_24360/g.54286  ORF Transcript_24360/g.54286 Transcript_24360/m.54286 type:complete len:431 (+) Transcript_24360:74-1366(+)